MALKKTCTTDYGNTVEYWKVVELSLNWISKIGRIRLAGYVNQDTRGDNKQYLESKFYNVNPKEFDEYFGVEALGSVNPIEGSYNLIKIKDQFFADADTV